MKSILGSYDQERLVRLIRDLYEASASTRRFLHGRLAPSPTIIEEYRERVADAVYPDPFSQRPIRLRDATAAITEYERATGDAAGRTDLMLTFVEAGTEQAADLGYGDEAYFSALERKVEAVLKSCPALPASVQSDVASRLRRVRDRAQDIGWGYGDYLGDVAERLPNPVAAGPNAE